VPKLDLAQAIGLRRCPIDVRHSAHARLAFSAAPIPSAKSRAPRPPIQSRLFPSAARSRHRSAAVIVVKVGLVPFENPGCALSAKDYLTAALSFTNYGHGGAGFHSLLACAEEVCAIASRTVRVQSHKTELTFERSMCVTGTLNSILGRARLRRAASDGMIAHEKLISGNLAKHEPQSPQHRSRADRNEGETTG